MTIIVTPEQGGTGSDATLTNDKVIVSSGDTFIETTTTTTQVNLLDTINSIETGTADNDKLVTQGYGDDHWAGGGHLDQQQIYYVGKAGSDTNDGKSVESPFLTIGKANTEVSGQTPSSSNQFVIKTIGAAIWNETGLGIPTYTTLDISDGVFTGTITSMAANSRFFFDEIRPVVGPTNTITVTGAGTRWIEGSYTTPATNATLIFTGTSAYVHLDIKDTNMQTTGAKVYSANTGSVIYLTANKFKETAASYNDSSARIFLVIKDEGSNADTHIQNQVGDIIIDTSSPGVGGNVIIKDIQNIFETTGSYYKFPNMPLFKARVTSQQANVTGSGVGYIINFGAEDFDVNNDFNLGSNTFVAPTPGKYLITAKIVLAGLTSSHTLGFLQLLSSAGNLILFEMDIKQIRTPSGTFTWSVGPEFMNLIASDTVQLEVRISNGLQVVSVEAGTSLAGYLISE